MYAYAPDKYFMKPLFFLALMAIGRFLCLKYQVNILQSVSKGEQRTIISAKSLMFTSTLQGNYTLRVLKELRSPFIACMAEFKLA